MSQTSGENVKFGKYTLQRKLAVGGMAEIFLATQEGLAGFHKNLVIKRILPHFAEDKKFVEMFFDEARVAANFTNNNIVQIFDLGEADGHYFIAMEYIDGWDLAQLIERAASFGKRIPTPIAARIIADSLSGLYYAHTFKDPNSGEPLNLVHRDISPQNLLVNKDGIVKLVDFGIAKAKTSSSKTETGAVKGKFSYMAPEQIAGGKLDGRCDIFAMGIVLYELLLGVRPFGEHSDLLAITAIVHQPPRNPREIDEHFPAEIEGILDRALAKNPADRYADAFEMQRDLETYLQRCGAFISSREVATYLENLFSDTPQDLDSIGLGASNTHSIQIGNLAAQASPQAALTNPGPATQSQPPLSQPTQSQPPLSPPPQNQPLPNLSLQGPPVSNTGPQPSPAPLAEPPKKGKGLLIAVVIIALLVLGGGSVLAYMLLAQSSDETEGSAKDDKDDKEDKEDPAQADSSGVADEADLSEEAELTEADQGQAQDDPDATEGEDSKQAAAGDLSEDTTQADTTAAEDLSAEDSGEEPGGFGEVKLAVKPSRLKAVAYLNGKKLGKLPLKLSFPAGKNTVELIVESPRASKKVIIDVPSGGEVSETIAIEKASLFLTAPEGAKVKVDGKSYGKAPITKKIVVWEGLHEVELEVDGSVKTYSVPLGAGKNEISLPPK